MIYLASPFSSPDPTVRHDRYEKAAKLTVALIHRGYHVFSPIVHSFELAERFGLCGSWEFWKKLDLDFLDRCDELWVYMLPGWERSVGVTAEMEHAQKTSKRTVLVSESVAKKLMEAHA